MGEIIITLYSKRTIGTLRIYVHEFLGSDEPPTDLRHLVDGFVTFPGYGKSTLPPSVAGDSLTWAQYGKALSGALSQSFSQPVELLGNSMGAMVSIYAALETPSNISRLILFKVPTFGYLRPKASKLYAHVAKIMVDEEAKHSFIRRLQTSVSSSVMDTLISTKWQDVRRLYIGAAKSDLDIDKVSSIEMPVYFLKSTPDINKAHPLEARNYLLTLMTGSHNKQIIEFEELEKRAGI